MNLSTYKQMNNYRYIYGNHLQESNRTAGDKKGHEIFKNSFADLKLRVDTVEKRINELPNRTIKIIQKKTQRKRECGGKKKMQNNIKSSKIDIIGGPSRNKKRNEAEDIFEEIMAEDLEKSIKKKKRSKQLREPKVK